MIAEFSVVPLGKGESVSGYVAECLKIVRASGIRHQLTPMATVLEGEWGEVMDVIARCHQRIMGMSDRVIITIRIDDRKGEKDAMTHKIASVQAKLD